MKIANFILILCSALVLGCKEENTSSNNNQYNEDIGNKEEISSAIEFVKPSEIKSKTLDGIEFSVSGISAVDYIQRKGEKIENGDLEQLKKETVFILEFTDENKYKNIFESDKMLFDKDKAIQYLIGDLGKDFKIKQEGELIAINGFNYEGQIGAQNKIRITFYAKGINLNKTYVVEYYDRLFGKGLMKFKSRVNELIS